MAKNKFTTDPPVAEGWYWIYGLMKYDENEPALFLCNASGWWDSRGGYYEDFTDGLLFMGPVDKPEIPEK